MDKKTKQLVGLAAAVASNCNICIDQHLSRCDDSLVRSEEVVETIAIALAVRHDAEIAISKHVHDLLNDYPQKAN